MEGSTFIRTYMHGMQNEGVAFKILMLLCIRPIVLQVKLHLLLISFASRVSEITGRSFLLSVTQCDLVVVSPA